MVTATAAAAKKKIRSLESRVCTFLPVLFSRTALRHFAWFSANPSHLLIAILHVERKQLSVILTDLASVQFAYGDAVCSRGLHKVWPRRFLDKHRIKQACGGLSGFWPNRILSPCEMEWEKTNIFQPRENHFVFDQRALFVMEICSTLRISNCSIDSVFGIYTTPKVIQKVS